MTKADLVEKVTGAGDLTRHDSEVIVETIFDAVIGALSERRQDRDSRLRLLPYPPAQSRIGRNPKTGERVEVPAKHVPYFKPSKDLRTAGQSRRGNQRGVRGELSSEASSHRWRLVQLR